jgi:hypothetical protein
VGILRWFGAVLHGLAEVPDVPGMGSAKESILADLVDSDPEAYHLGTSWYRHPTMLL